MFAANGGGPSQFQSATHNAMWSSFDTSPKSVRRIALLVAVVAFLFSGITSYHAAHNEITGTAIYRRPTGAKGSTPEPVTRESSPTKFRSATNSLWMMGGFSLMVAIIGITFFRKLNDCADSSF